MDLLLFLRVIWSRKWVLVGGLGLAIVLAFLSFFRVDIHGGNHLQYREKQQWASYATLFVTQHGFPWGTTSASTTSGTGADATTTHAADPSRFVSLALIYSQLIPTDAVRKIMLRHGPINGIVQAAALTDPSNTSDALPLISVAGLSDSPKNATALVHRATQAFLTFLADEQTGAGTAPADRVVVQVINRPGQPKLLADRSTTLPIVIFFTMALATIAICFILENLSPRVRLTTVESQNSRLAEAPRIA